MDTDIQKLTKNNPATLRLFFAFNADPKVFSIADNFSDLNSFTKGIRINRNANLHLTLLFCGAVDKNKLIDLIRLTDDFFTHRYMNPIFENPVVTVKKNRKGGMIWIQFDGNTAFSNLNRSLFDKVKSICTHSKLIEDPIPHITIARFKKDTRILLPENPVTNFEYKPSGFELWASCSGKNGLIYLPVFKFNPGRRSELAG